MKEIVVMSGGLGNHMTDLFTPIRDTDQSEPALPFYGPPTDEIPTVPSEDVSPQQPTEPGPSVQS